MPSKDAPWAKKKVDPAVLERAQRRERRHELRQSREDAVAGEDADLTKEERREQKRERAFKPIAVMGVDARARRAKMNQTLYFSEDLKLEKSEGSQLVDPELKSASGELLTPDEWNVKFTSDPSPSGRWWVEKGEEGLLKLNWAGLPEGGAQVQFSAWKFRGAIHS